MFFKQQVYKNLNGMPSNALKCYILVQCEPPNDSVQLVNIAPITMVYGTQITIVTGAFVNQLTSLGGAHCRNHWDDLPTLKNSELLPMLDDPDVFCQPWRHGDMSNKSHPTKKSTGVASGNLLHSWFQWVMIIFLIQMVFLEDLETWYTLW